VHMKIRYQCKECGGSSICQHGRLKYNKTKCKECLQEGITYGLCIHKKRRTVCVECKAAAASSVSVPVGVAPSPLS
jgi:hypothetical protein